MLLEPTGKALFWELCNKLIELKLVIEEEKKWSVPFVFHDDIKVKANNKNSERQVATVQFNGGVAKYKKNQVIGVTLRLYLSPLQVFGLQSVLDNHTSFRSKIKGPVETPYFDYTFDQPYSSKEVQDCINRLFSDLSKVFTNKLSPRQEKLPIESLSEGIKELPRVDIDQ